MVLNRIAFYINKIKSAADWHLLAFLLLFLNVKLAVKIPAIILIYIFRFNFKFGFKFKNSRLPLFYLLIMVIPFISILFNRQAVNLNYIVVILIGMAFWLLCILAIHQVKFSVERNDTAIIHQTLLVFFAVNALVSFINIALIVKATGNINPYTYQGEYQKYFISTGDYIRGLTFDTSTTNAVLSAFGVVYFLGRKNAVMLFVCMATLLLTGSNFINLVLLLIFILLFAFKTDKLQKSFIVICLVFLGIFMAKVSPQNDKYASETVARLFHKEVVTPLPVTGINIAAANNTPLTLDERRRKMALAYTDSVYAVLHPPKSVIVMPATEIYKAEGGRIAIKGPPIHTATYQSSTQTPPEQRQLVEFISTHKQALAITGKEEALPTLPGKAAGFLQTINFFHGNPARILAGAGMGNFSSKLAFRATGLGFAGGYPHKFIYIDHDFMVNHLNLYLNFFSRRSGFHSLTNSPFSVYDQLLGEYGLIGLLVFAIYYLGFFARHYKKLTYGLPVLLLMLSAFFVEYWFEQLSVLILFELLLLLNIKENSTPKPLTNEL
ncbi:hypothetical protein SAMN05216464_101203 [Mucilaginibacter pineti]|uniref:O-Antigen ligase n=1 Tax=Mucilaginibacter pineti TaxID=1391627 RepID=A0A1G6T8W8_9SPHI|nr:hypothetical protein [Mucilaginibacter pineti]SDD24897.1 hypothetical protein SAMN05216464_101203 [Mucilaginibacter pineti]